MQDFCQTCADPDDANTCICLQDSIVETAVVEEYVVPTDNMKPVIKLNVGDGELAQLPSGATVVIHRYVQFSSGFVDPGATATDNIDGDLSRSISRFGVGAVDMNVLAPEDDPYIISYDVSDSAGNAAQVSRCAFVGRVYGVWWMVYGRAYPTNRGAAVDRSTCHSHNSAALALRALTRSSPICEPGRGSTRGCCCVFLRINHLRAGGSRLLFFVERLSHACRTAESANALLWNVSSSEGASVPVHSSLV